MYNQVDTQGSLLCPLSVHHTSMCWVTLADHTLFLWNTPALCKKKFPIFLLTAECNMPLFFFFTEIIFQRGKKKVYNHINFMPISWTKFNHFRWHMCSFKHSCYLLLLPEYLHRNMDTKMSESLLVRRHSGSSLKYCFTRSATSYACKASKSCASGSDSISFRSFCIRDRTPDFLNIPTESPPVRRRNLIAWRIHCGNACPVLWIIT